MPTPRSNRRQTIKPAAQGLPKATQTPDNDNQAHRPEVTKNVRPQPPRRARGEKTALDLLLDAHDRAALLGQDVWQFAVERSTLNAAGVSDIDLRALVWLGWIESRRELVEIGALTRRFGAADGVHIAERSCFVLTAAALSAARRPKRKRRSPAVKGKAKGAILASTAMQAQFPFWDAGKRELWFGDKLVKRFKQPAEDQEMILASFQEQGWPPRIEDPLLPKPGHDPKQRLRKTVQNLKRAHINRVMDFYAGGDGQSIGWRVYT